MFWMALMGCLWMVWSSGIEGIRTLPSRVDGEIFVGLLYLGVVASAGMFFLQAFAQRHVSAEKAAVIYAMEPVFAALFSWLWLSEVLTMRAALGAAIVVFAVVLSELKPASYPPPT
jgi:drug/metabolite transporter (DMT)-like permease